MPGRPGVLLVWSLAVQNAGNQGLEAVVLSETVPPLTTFSAADSSPGWSCAGVAPGSLCTLLTWGGTGRDTLLCLRRPRLARHPEGRQELTQLGRPAPSMAGHCAHCDAKLTSGKFDWVRSKIEQDDSYTGVTRAEPER